MTYSAIFFNITKTISKKTEEPMGYANLAEMFFSTCNKFPAKTGMMFKKDDVYLSLSFKEIREAVLNIAAGLASLGVKKDDKVVLLSENCKECISNN